MVPPFPHCLMASLIAGTSSMASKPLACTVHAFSAVGLAVLRTASSAATALMKEAFMLVVLLDGWNLDTQLDEGLCPFE